MLLVVNLQEGSILRPYLHKLDFGTNIQKFLTVKNLKAEAHASVFDAWKEAVVQHQEVAAATLPTFWWFFSSIKEGLGERNLFSDNKRLNISGIHPPTPEIVWKVQIGEDT